MRLNTTAYYRNLSRDPTRPAGELYYCLMALVLSVRVVQTHDFFIFLIALRYWIMSFLTAIRLPPDKPILLQHRVISYISFFMPMFFQPALLSISSIQYSLGRGLGILGSVLSITAMLHLGKRFGASPAKRGEICRSGLYRWLKHPIYIGYGITELGGALLNPINILLFLISASLFIMRARIEEAVLEEHPAT